MLHVSILGFGLMILAYMHQAQQYSCLVSNEITVASMDINPFFLFVAIASNFCCSHLHFIYVFYLFFVKSNIHSLSMFLSIVSNQRTH